MKKETEKETEIETEMKKEKEDEIRKEAEKLELEEWKSMPSPPSPSSINEDLFELQKVLNLLKNLWKKIK